LAQADVRDKPILGHSLLGLENPNNQLDDMLAYFGRDLRSNLDHDHLKQTENHILRVLILLTLTDSCLLKHI
jgi:hypothetical protein